MSELQKKSEVQKKSEGAKESEDALKTLEGKIDQLITLCAQLNRENQALKRENLGYQQERRDLIAKNEMARARVEATLQRLRSMEAAS